MSVSNIQLSQAEQMNRFHQLEDTIRHCPCDIQQVTLQEAHLNEYIDLALDMASKAGLFNNTRLQESWLKRVYNTLLATTLDGVEPEHWRKICFEYLYQPLFALKHLYLNNSQSQRRIQTLYQELSVASHYLY
jgi:hypothetical protein